MNTREIAFEGQSIALCGSSTDSYFQHATPDAPFVFAMRELPSNAVVFDVGANIGMTAAIAAKRGAAVHAFEPDPRIFSMLKETIHANTGEVHPHCLALGAEPGELSFFADPNSGSASHLISTNTLGRASEAVVKVSTLDAFVNASEIDRLDLIKIDVEGFEIDVLRGAKSTLERFEPSVLVEFNAFTMVGFRNINPRDFLDFLRGTFPYIYKFRQPDGTLQAKPVIISNDAEALTFIHDNLVSAGCVDDLYCCFEPI